MSKSAKVHLHSHLAGNSSRSIKRLKDFKVGHSVPKEVNHATRRFAKACASKDIQEELEQIWLLCREEFKYKRKDKIGPMIEAGSGSLTLPDFKFSVLVEQDEEKPDCVIWHLRIDEISDLNTVLSQPFNRVFSGKFDTLEASFSGPQKIEDIIDRIEELDSKAISVNYPADCSSCEVFVKALGISIYITSNRYRFMLPDCPSPRVLVEKIMEIQKSIQSFSPENPLVDFT